MCDATQPDMTESRASTLEGYDEWLDELKAKEEAYEREMANRLAAAKDRLREEGRDGDLR